MHHSKIHQEKSNKIKNMCQNFIIPYLYEAQHVSGDTPLIIRSLKTALAASGFSYVEGCLDVPTRCKNVSKFYYSNFI
jgi:hypothetical protein